MTRTRVWLASMTVVSLCVGGVAHAKGEGGGISGLCFGRDVLVANAVRFPEARPDAIVVSTNFGLLLSRDGGETFGWVCPQVYGAQIAGDFTLFTLPGVVTLPDGTFFVLSGGLGYFVSSEDGCRYESAPDPDLQSATVVSVASRAAAPGVVLAALSWPGRQPFGIYRSDDGGREFDATDLQSDGLLRFGGVHLTAGGERAYVTTRIREQLTGLWHSDESLSGWTAAVAELEAQNASVAASRPGNPDEIFVAATESIMGACDFEVAVMRSDDAGDTFELVQRRAEILVGVVVDVDGAVWMGWKDSGLEVSRGGVLEPVDGSPTPIGCLAEAPNGGLAVCPLDDSGVLVSVRDPDTGAFDPLVTLDRVTGPLACAAGTPVETECTQRWTEISSFWALGPHGPDLDAGTPDGAAGDSEEGGPAGDGCACAVDGSRTAPAGGPLLLLAVALGAAMSSRRSRGAGDRSRL